PTWSPLLPEFGKLLFAESKGANLPVALRSTGMPSDEEPIEMQAIPNPKTRGSAVQLRVKSSAT
ncbi:MAG: hypothetical protein JZU64_14545, partial [Rhodoferax sp.]|nr:hypothetical protein [Rhodoferax sp.]